MNSSDRATDVSYRLGITTILVGGSVTTTEGDPDSPDTTGPVTTGQLAVTTATTADQLTERRLRLSAGQDATLTSTVSLLDDERLTGADVATTAEPAAGWAAALKVGGIAAGTALAVGAAPLTAVLVGGAGLALGGAFLASGGSETFDLLQRRGELDDIDLLDIPLPDVAAEAKIATKFVEEHPDEARLLSAYRVAIGHTLVAHAREALRAGSPAEGGRARLRDIELSLASIRRGAEQLEAVYTAWRASQVTTTTEVVSLELPINAFPTTEELRDWVATDRPATGPAPAIADVTDWEGLAIRHGLAISVDVPPQGRHASVNQVDEGEPTGGLLTAYDEVTYRPPRPVTISVWKFDDKRPDGEKLALRERSRVAALVPGNETTVWLGKRDATGKVAATFSSSGALTQVTMETADAKLQRAKDLTALVDGATSGLTEGKALGALFAPPTAAESLEREKAERDLRALRNPTPDPLAKIKADLEAKRLQAQLRIAEQLAQSSTPLSVVVNVGEMA